MRKPEVLAVVFVIVALLGVYVWGACAASTKSSVKKARPNNTFILTKPYDEAWISLNQALRKHKLDANKDTGIIRTEPLVVESDMYNAGMGSACEVYSWVIIARKEAEDRVHVTVERDLAVYDAAFGSIVCNEMLSNTKSTVHVGYGMNVAATAKKSIANPKTSYRLENAGTFYLVNAVRGRVDHGRMPESALNN